MAKIKPHVVVARRIPEAGLKLLRDNYDLKVSTHDRALKPIELHKIVKGAVAVLSLLTDKVDDKFFRAAGPQLKIVANYAVGYDNINLIAAKRHKVIVTNTPGVLTEAVAEHTFSLLMSVARRIVESDKFVRAGKYKEWAPELLLGPQLSGKTLGVLGLGRIGKRVAEIAAKGYGMKVVYFNRGKRDREIDKALGAKAVTFRKLLTASDFLSVHVPLTKQTKHLIDRRELQSMKPTAILINTSRGPVVNEKALTQALAKKELWGAGLDVFEQEPKVTPGLLKLDNVILTPHTASATNEARDAMAEIAAKNVIAVLSGRKPLNPVQ